MKNRKYRVAQYGDLYFPQLYTEIEIGTSLLGKPKMEMAYVFCNVFGGIFTSYHEPISMFNSLIEAKDAIKAFDDKMPIPIYHNID